MCQVKYVILVILILSIFAELSDCKKSRNAVKRRNKNPTKISATYRIVPYKNNRIQKRNAKMSSIPTWPTLPVYPGAYTFPQSTSTFAHLRSPLTSTSTYTHWPTLSALPTIRNLEYANTALNMPPLTANSLRRSDDFFINQPSTMFPTQTSFIDMSAFGNGQITANSDDFSNTFIAKEPLPLWAFRAMTNDIKPNLFNTPFNTPFDFVDRIDGSFANVFV